MKLWARQLVRQRRLSMKVVPCGIAFLSGFFLHWWSEVLVYDTVRAVLGVWYRLNAAGVDYYQYHRRMIWYSYRYPEKNSHAEYSAKRWEICWRIKTRCEWNSVVYLNGKFTCTCDSNFNITQLDTDYTFVEVLSCILGLNWFIILFYCLATFSL